MKELKPLEWPFPKTEHRIFHDNPKLKDYETRKRIMKLCYKVAMSKMGVYFK